MLIHQARAAAVARRKENENPNSENGTTTKRERKRKKRCVKRNVCLWWMNEMNECVMSGTLLVTACLQLYSPNLPLRPQTHLLRSSIFLFYFLSFSHPNFQSFFFFFFLSLIPISKHFISINFNISSNNLTILIFLPFFFLQK